ncbi:hypothetical protein M8J75_006230 [Diaphorina citri]|nr:hypothetical protein M8J75_006230 [Diaphorina citri]
MDSENSDERLTHPPKAYPGVEKTQFQQTVMSTPNKDLHGSTTTKAAAATPQASSSLQPGQDQDPFQKSTRTPRSPTENTKGDTNRSGKGEEYSSTPISEDGKKPKKRKPNFSPQMEPKEQELTQQSTVDEMLQMVQDAAKIASAMKVHVEQTVNTKAGIKKGVIDIFSVMKKLVKKSIQLKAEQVSTPKTTPQTVAEVVGPQIREEIYQLTRDPISRTEDKINTLMEKEWPTTAFSKTSLCAGAPESTTTISAIVVFGEEEKPKLLEIMLRKNPDLQILLEEGIDVGEFKFIENITRSSTGKTHTKKTFLAKANDEMSLIKLVDDIHKSEQSKLYKLAVEDSFDLPRTRKVLEIAANFTDVQIEMHVPRGKMKTDYKVANSETTKNFTTKSRSKPKVIHVKVTDKNKPIDAIVTEMKQKIDVDKIGVKVKSIKTNEQNGSFKIITKGENDNEAMVELANQIQSSLEGVTAKSESAFENSVIIRNIDTVTSVQQLAAAVASKLGRGASEFEAKINLKPTQRRDAQVAMIRLNNDDLSKLGKSFRLGWTDCVVEKMIIPKRCLNCRGYGHIAKNCKEEKFDTAGRCRRCNESGHDSRTCTKEPQCRDCNTSGHISGTMACERYRNLVREAKKTPRRKKGRLKPNERLRRLAMDNASVISSDTNLSRRMSLDDDQVDSNSVT